MLSFFYRLLSRFKTPDDITKDMRATFEEARGDAWARGWWSYFAFAVREIGGLFGFPNTKLWWLRTAGWGLTGLAAGWLVSYLLPVRYTSEASLRLVPSSVSQDLLPRDAIDIEQLLDSVRPTVVSRNVIVTVINNFDLYPHSRRRLPMEEIAKEFRKSLHIESSGPNLIRVAFTYGDSPSGTGDRILTNKVTHNLVARLIVENTTQRSFRTAQTANFFRDQVEKVGRSWSKLNASVKATPASDPGYELLVLARDQKRREYESVTQKLAAAETLQDLANRGQDFTLELLDAASLPLWPDKASSATWLAGLGCGLAAGLLIELWRALRRTTPPDFAAPGAAAPA